MADSDTDMDDIDTKMVDIDDITPVGYSLYPSDQFVISCGTVTIDIKRQQVLLIDWQRQTETIKYVQGIQNTFIDKKPVYEIILPKGPKEIDESLHDAAIRETFEISGVKARLLPSNIMTQATIPSSFEEHQSILNTEPIGMSHRVEKGIVKVIFWYIALADSTLPLATKAWGEDEEHFYAFWENLIRARSRLTYEQDLRIFDEAINAVERGIRYILQSR